jgi:predicted AlkP superfamily phosphohydrolase/phosphomutase
VVDLKQFIKFLMRVIIRDRKERKVTKFLKFKALSIITLLFLYSGTATAQTDAKPSALINPNGPTNGHNSRGPFKLNWFIPDGVRADPDTFNIFKWAKTGKLPNIKRLMNMGSYGYSIPVFPTHTPTNFAALLTGTYPRTNGVADGPMRLEGQSLQLPALGGFSSAARTKPAIWSQFSADKKIVLVSVPGSTPPELKRNALTLRGRWGGWGADLHSIIFEKNSVIQRKKLSRNSRLFFLGMELTRYVTPHAYAECESVFNIANTSCLKFVIYGTPIFAKLTKLNTANVVSPNALAFSVDSRKTAASLAEGQWSDWLPITVKWKGRAVKTNIRLHVIALGPGNFFRVRVLVDSLNSAIVAPSSAAKDLHADLGPMVDFVDNFPPQLIYHPNDKMTFLEESRMSFEWHRNSIDAIYKRYDPDIFIHDIYSPNVMLTSRWWMGYVDPNSSRYNDVTSKERATLFGEVLDMYKGLDAIVGKILDNADDDTLIVFSSDHGVIPLDQSVRLNNAFAKKGWIVYSINPKTGEHLIDWDKSKVVFLKMSHIYINPNGLGPVWTRGSGDAYESLRKEVLEVLSGLRDKNGVAPLALAVPWEEASLRLKLPANRSGDIIVANKPGFGWSEDITEDLEVFVLPVSTGYKQAILADNVKGLWTPFIIAGKGIKKNYKISHPISNVDQAPTILRALSVKILDHVEGKPVLEIFE